MHTIHPNLVQRNKINTAFRNIFKYINKKETAHFRTGLLFHLFIFCFSMLLRIRLFELKVFL